MFIILLTALLVPFIVLLSVIITCSVLFATRKLKIGVVVLSTFIVLVCILFFVPFPIKWFSNDNDKDIHEEKIGEGLYSNVYKHGEDKVIKQYKTSSEIRNYPDDLNFKILFCTSRKNFSTGMLLIISKIIFYMNWKVIHRIKKLNSKYFPVIYSIDDKRKRYIQERMSFKLTDETRPKNFKEQVKDLNKFLIKNDYFLLDFRDANVMVDKKNIIKVVDCQLLTRNEFNLLLSLNNLLRKKGPNKITIESNIFEYGLI